MRMLIEILQGWNNSWFRSPIGSRFNFLCSITHIDSKGLQLSKKLTFIHDGRASVFDQCSCYVVVGITVMSLKSTVEILGDSVRPLGEDLLIFVGL